MSYFNYGKYTKKKDNDNAGGEQSSGFFDYDKYKMKSSPLQPMVSRTNFESLGESLQPGNIANADSRMLAKPSSPTLTVSSVSDFANRTKPKVQTAQEFIQSQQQHRRELNPELYSGSGLMPLLTKYIGEPLATGIDYIQAYTPGLANFQQGAGNALGVETNTAPLTPGIVGKAGELAGNLAGFATNPAALEQSLLTAPYQAANAALATHAGQRAVQGIQTGVSRAANAVNPLLNRAGMNIGSNLTDNLAERALTGGIAGAIQNTAAEMNKGNTDLSDIGTAAATGAALGGLGDAGLSALSPLAKSIADRTGLTDKLMSFVNRSRTVNPELETATREVFAASPQRQIGVATGPLRNASQEQYINKVMKDITPIVHERMTPPLENTNELAKWLQPHLDTSLNQIRKLSYDDMVELANEVKSHMSMYDVAQKVAKQRGYDLDKILANQIPSIKQEAERLRMGRVAGAIEPPTQNVRVGVSPDYTPSVAPEVPAAPQPQQPVNWFTRLFGNQGVGISPFAKQGKAGTAAQIVTNATKRDAKGIMGAVSAAKDTTYQALVDALAPLKRTFGKETYDIAMDANRSNNIAEQIIRDKFVTPEGVVVGDSLNDVMKKVPRGTDDEFIDYIVLRDAKSRVKQGQKVYEEKLGMNDEQKIQDRIDMYDKRFPQFQEAAKAWDQFTKNLRTVYGLDTGLLNEAQIRGMEEARPFYAPMRRQFNMSERIKRGFQANTGGFSGQKAPIKEVSPTGSVRKIVDPRKTLIEATQQWVRASMNNRVMQNIIDQIKRDPEAFKNIAEIVQPKKGQKNLSQILGDEGEEGLIENINQDFSRLFQKTNLSDDNIVRGMVKGQPVYVRVKDPEAVRALTSLGPERADVLAKVFGAFSNLTKRSATGLLAPLFAVRGLTSDTVQSLIQSPNKVAHIGDFAHALVSSIAESIPGLNRTPLAKMAEDYRRSGGVYSSMLRTEKGLNKELGALKRNAILSPENIARGAYGALKSPFKALEKVGDIGENVNRMAAFRGEMRRQGFERTPENVRNAANAAREITTNFSRKGTISKPLESLIPYNNAAVQGIRTVLTSFKDHPIATTIGVISLSVIPKMMEYAAFGNDPDYQKLPARERYRNMIVSKNPDGTFVKIPMPPEYNAIGAFTEDLMRRYIGNDPEAMKGVADALMNAWTPPMVSGMAQGATQGGGIEQSMWGVINATSPGSFIGTAANQSFTGSPIVPQSMQDRSPQYQYDERTSSVAKYIGDKLNWSPKKIDYLLRAYGGDPARILLPLTSETGKGKTTQTLLKNFVVDPEYTNTLADDFYTAKELIQRAYSDNKDVGAPLPSWYNEGIRKMVTSTAKGSYMSKLKSLTNQKNVIDKDNTLTPEAKANKLRDIQFQINSLYTELNSKLVDAGVPIKGR